MFGKKKKGKKGDAPEAEAEAPAAAAEATAEGAEGEAPAKKKLPLKLIAIGAAGLLVLGGGGGGAAWFFLLKDKAPAEGAEHAEAGDHAQPKAKAKSKDKGHGGPPAEGAGAIRPGPDGVYFYTMPDLQANLQSTDGRPNHLSLKVTFELANEHDGAVIDEQMPRVQDLLQTFLRELRPDDLNGSQGHYRLRQEIQRRMNLVLAPAEVKAVLIEELLQT